MNSRAVTETLLAAAGTVLAVAGPRMLLDMARWSVRHGGILLLGLAAAVTLWIAVPAGKRKWPMLLAGAGVVVLLLQHGVSPSIIAGGGVVALGALVSAVRPSSVFRDDLVDPVHTYRRVGYARKIVARHGHRVPDQIRLLSVATRTELNLEEAQSGTDEFLELVLTCWLSHIEITLPSHWAVVAGRVAATRHITFVGDLDSAEVFTDIKLPEQLKILKSVVAARSRGIANGARDDVVGVVIHVAGGFGRVTLNR